MVCRKDYTIYGLWSNSPDNIINCSNYLPYLVEKVKYKGYLNKQTRKIAKEVSKILETIYFIIRKYTNHLW